MRFRAVASTTGARTQYDWRACAISLVAGFAVAVRAGLAVMHLRLGHTRVVIVTLVGTASAVDHARVAKTRSRPIEEDDSCPS